MLQVLQYKLKMPQYEFKMLQHGRSTMHDVRQSPVLQKKILCPH
jgi:hypothetical protein